MNKKLSGGISYEMLRQLVVDYYKTQNMNIVYPSIGYLEDELKSNGQSSNYFILKDGIGESKLNLSKEQIVSLVKSYGEQNGLEVADVNFGDKIEVSYMVKKGLEIPEPIKTETQENTNQLSENEFTSKMQYADLRQMVFDHFKTTKNIELGSISIDYLKDKINSGDMTNGQPFFIVNTAFGESRFDFSKEELINIVKTQLASKNCELTNISFDNYGINVSYKQKLVQKQETVEQPKLDGEVRIDGHLQVLSEPQEEKKEEHTQSSPQQTNTDSQDELVRMAKEQRKFTILQRERAMNEAQKAKNRSAILAGACLLGACVAVYFNGADINQVLQHEMNAIYSWEALGQYMADLGPFTTVMAAGVGAFMAKYFKNSRKFKKAQNEFIDMNNSIMQENINELGGEENAKSR